jgi:hypothetical protein
MKTDNFAAALMKGEIHDISKQCCGESLPREAILQHRRVPLSSPGTYATRSLGQTDSSMKIIARPCRAAIFLRRATSWACQVRVVLSLRWRAWSVGRCTLQRSVPSNGHTEEWFKRTAKHCWTSASLEFLQSAFIVHQCLEYNYSKSSDGKRRKKYQSIMEGSRSGIQI